MASKDTADRSSDKAASDRKSKADDVAPDDKHKTEKLTSHDGIDPNAGQE